MKYKLKPTEKQLLIFVQQQSDTILAGIISTIASDHYKLQPNTQFKLSTDYSELEIYESDTKLTDAIVKGK
jgi:hypothetical protein